MAVERPGCFRCKHLVPLGGGGYNLCMRAYYVIDNKLPTGVEQKQETFIDPAGDKVSCSVFVCRAHNDSGLALSREEVEKKCDSVE